VTRLVPIKRVARVRYGLGQPPPPSDDGVPIVRATNIFRGLITPEGMIYSRLEDLPLERAPLLVAGEILVVRSGAYTGDSALVSDEWAGSAPGYDLRLTPFAIEPRFLALQLLGRRCRDQINLVKSRAAQPHLNAEDLGALQVLSLDSREEERSVLSVLDTRLAEIDPLLLDLASMRSLVAELREAVVASSFEDLLDASGIGR
jgi:type I restriction enzyme, S subunit